jgi:hypothetical protein
MKNIETMDKVQKIDRSNTAPSLKTFRDEYVFMVLHRLRSIATRLSLR